jgi:hypothetical protein
MLPLPYFRISNWKGVDNLSQVEVLFGQTIQFMGKQNDLAIIGIIKSVK